MTLTTVLLSYNHRAYVGDALEAILSQSRAADEVIVLDDASTDGSGEILHTLAAGRSTLSVNLNTRNLGAVRNMNRGLQQASGDLIYFAASDDRVLPGFFENAVALLERYPEAGLCSALSAQMDEAGDSLGLFPSAVVRWHGAYLWPRECDDFLRGDDAWFMGNATIFRRDALIAAGGFREDLESYCDGFVSRLLAVRHGACFWPGLGSTWRRTTAGFASSVGQDPVRTARIAARAHALRCSEFGQDFRTVLRMRLLGRSRFEVARTVLDAGVLPDAAEFHSDILRLGLSMGSLRRLLALATVLTGRCATLLAFAAFRWRDVPGLVRRKAGQIAFLRCGPGRKLAIPA